MGYKVLTKNGIDNSNIDGARGEYFNSGMRDGIVQGVLNEGTFISNSSNSITFDSCELRIAGHRVVIDSPVYQTFSNKPSVDTRYSYIAQIIVDDTKDVFFSIFVQSSSTKLIQDNLYHTINGTGTYQVEIGRFTQLTDGTITDVVRTINVITGSSNSGSGTINIGNVVTEKIAPNLDAEVDIDPRYEEDEGKEYIDFKFALPVDMTDTINKSNQALTNSQTAISNSEQAILTANSANEKSDNAISTADDANTKADNAVATANSANSVASNANTKSDNAVEISNQANQTANNALSTATNADEKSDTAITTANDASSKSDTAITTATTANENSNNAINTSNETKTYVEHLVDTPDTSEAGNVGTPNVEFIDNVVNGVTYKRFKFSNLKGQKGDPGEQGEKGDPGEQGEKGEDGETIDSFYSYTVDDPFDENYTKTMVEMTTNNNIYAFEVKARKGANGTNATIENATASVDSGIGTPSVDITVGGTDQARTFDFAFHNLKGEKGDEVILDAQLSSTSTNGIQNNVVTNALEGKVDKVTGKGLSTNDYTSVEKDKLAGIEAGAEVNAPIDTALSTTSTNSVQNKAIATAINDIESTISGFYNASTHTLTVDNMEINTSIASSIINAILTGSVNRGDKITQKRFNSSSGCITFASGLKLQWGTMTPTSVQANITTNYYEPFNAFSRVVIEQLGGGAAAVQYYNSHKCISTSTSGFTWQNGQSEKPKFQYIAIGY